MVLCPQIQSDLKILRSLYRSRTQFNLTKRDEIHSKREFVEILRKDWDLRRDVRFVEPDGLSHVLKEKNGTCRKVRMGIETIDKTKNTKREIITITGAFEEEKETTTVTKRMNQRIGSIDEEARKRVLRKPHG